MEEARAATGAPQNRIWGKSPPAVPSIFVAADLFSLQILTYLDGEVKVEETELKPRVGFVHPVLSHNISLFINATREHDSGQYICSVNVVDDIINPIRNVAIINLTVLGKDTQGALRPLVSPVLALTLIWCPQCRQPPLSAG